MKILQRWKQTALHNKALVVTSILVAIGTLFYTGAAIFQYCLMKQSALEQLNLMKQTAKENSEQIDKLIADTSNIANAAKGNLEQGKRALNASIEMGRRDQRAWVEIEPIKPIPFTKADGTFGASFKYEIYLKNVGKTVARDILMRANHAKSGLALGDNAHQVRAAQDSLRREYL